MSFLKKNWSNLLLIVFLILLFIPQTRVPIQVALNKLISVGPSEVLEKKRVHLQNYQWPLVNLDGENINLDRSKGRVAIVNLWATWCPPCIAEMPSFQDLYNEYGEKVDFYFITSEKGEKVNTFLLKKNYTIPVYQPIAVGPDELASGSLPTTYVISKKGEIVVKTTGAANWNDGDFKNLLDRLLKEEMLN